MLETATTLGALTGVLLAGVLAVPFLLFLFAAILLVSAWQMTSNFMIGVTVAASAAAYFARGDIDPAIAGPVALGSVLGALLGVRLLMAVSGERLRLVFVVVPDLGLRDPTLDCHAAHGLLIAP